MKYQKNPISVIACLLELHSHFVVDISGYYLIIHTLHENEGRFWTFFPGTEFNCQ